MIWKSKRSAFDAFSDGVKAGYRSGYDDGYQQALDDLRKQIREDRGSLQWEDMRNGKVYSGAEEDKT